MQGIPYRSKLLPHFERIRSERMMRKTWREISELLEEKHGIKASPSNVYEFFKRKLRSNSTPLGFPDEDSAKVTIEETEYKSSKVDDTSANRNLQKTRKPRTTNKLSEKKAEQITDVEQKTQEIVRLSEERGRLKEEEDRKLQEAAQLAEEEARLKMEEDRKTREAARLAEEEARLKMEEDRKLQEAAQLAEEEARLKNEELRKRLEGAKLDESKPNQITEDKVKVDKLAPQRSKPKRTEWGNFDFQMAEQNEDLPD